MANRVVRDYMDIFLNSILAALVTGLLLTQSRVDIKVSLYVSLLVFTIVGIVGCLIEFKRRLSDIWDNKSNLELGEKNK